MTSKIEFTSDNKKSVRGSFLPQRILRVMNLNRNEEPHGTASLRGGVRGGGKGLGACAQLAKGIRSETPPPQVADKRRRFARAGVKGWSF